MPSTHLLVDIHERSSSSLRIYGAWLHDLLRWQVLVTRTIYATLADDPYRGLYLPEGEIDLLLDAWPQLDPVLLAQHEQLLQTGKQLWQTTPSSLHDLADRYGLSRREGLIMLLALAPELDPRYERLYGYVQDDVNKKRPSVFLAGRLLCRSAQELTQFYQYFAPDAPLVREHLIEWIPEPQAGFVQRRFMLDQRVVAALLGIQQLDPRLSSWCRVSFPTQSSTSLIMNQAWLHSLLQMVAEHADLVVGLLGSYGSCRCTLARVMAAHVDRPLLEFSLAAALASDTPLPTILAYLRRDMLLRDAVLYIKDVPQVSHTAEAPHWQEPLIQWLQDLAGTVCIALSEPWHAQGLTTYMLVHVPDLSYSEREQVWRRYTHNGLDAAIYEHLSSTFRLNAGQIRDAVQLAQRLATFNGHATLTSKDLFAACRAQSGERLATLARKIEPTYAWDDLVLPVEMLAQLQEMCVQVRQRRTVLERWGFEQHLAMGKGINALFAGQSGTGKTMAAEVIAADLGLDLYKVNLSTMVSKYIGETEKNLEQIFEAARQANAILFFDEADSIFGKRSEVRDAHDRYANMEVGYLLQKMEEYDGIVILATNLSKNMDDAFVRRLHVAIEFPFPEEPDRLEIWRKVFPAATPLADDLDLSFMAQQFRLSGGNIRNIALLAAFLAAEDGDQLCMSHVIRATRREYQKLGRLVTESTFGPYISLVRQEGKSHGRF